MTAIRWPKIEVSFEESSFKEEIIEPLDSTKYNSEASMVEINPTPPPFLFNANPEIFKPLEKRNSMASYEMNIPLISTSYTPKIDEKTSLINNFDEENFLEENSISLQSEESITPFSLTEESKEASVNSFSEVTIESSFESNDSPKGD